MAKASDNPGVNDYSSTVRKVLIVDSSGPSGGSWIEGATDTLSGTVTTSEIVLSQGSSGQVVQNVQVSALGVTGVLTIQFFDGTPAANNAITGPLYLSAQPAGGFKIPLTALTTNSLGWVLGGRSGGGTAIYFNLVYGY